MADDDLGRWAAKAARLPIALVQGTPDAVRAGGEVLQQGADRRLRSVTGGDNRLSRVRSGRGAAITLKLDIVGAGSSAEARMIPTGPIMLVENDTRGHTQPFVYKVRRRVKAKRTGVIAFGGGVYSRVRHPGTRGRKPIALSFTENSARAGIAGSDAFVKIVNDTLGT